MWVFRNSSWTNLYAFLHQIMIHSIIHQILLKLHSKKIILSFVCLKFRFLDDWHQLPSSTPFRRWWQLLPRKECCRSEEPSWLDGALPSLEPPSLSGPATWRTWCVWSPSMPNIPEVPLLPFASVVEGERQFMEWCSRNCWSETVVECWKVRWSSYPRRGRRPGNRGWLRWGIFRWRRLPLLF